MNGAVVATNRHLRLIIAFSLSLVVLYILTGCGIADRESAQSASHVMALSIEKEIICPVCPGETIDQSQVQIAKQMRDLVRVKIAEGETREQILDYFVERYGPAILAEPKKGGSTLLVWLVPPGAILTGGVILALVLRRMVLKKSEVSDATEKGEKDVVRFLDIVDVRLGKETDDEARG